MILYLTDNILFRDQSWRSISHCWKDSERVNKTGHYFLLLESGRRVFRVLNNGSCNAFKCWNSSIQYLVVSLLDQRRNSSKLSTYLFNFDLLGWLVIIHYHLKIHLQIVNETDAIETNFTSITNITDSKIESNYYHNGNLFELVYILSIVGIVLSNMIRGLAFTKVICTKV